MDEDNLDELLNKEPEAPVEAPAAVEPAAVRDEQGRFVKTGDEPQATAEPVPPTAMVPLAAKTDEVRKRQRLEDEVQTLKQQLQALQAPAEPPPSLWEDEQGWQKHFGSQVVSTAVQQATFNAKLDMSEMMVRQANPDFEEVKAEFLALAEKNPALAEQALSDPHPWNKAYTIAKNARTMQELGTTDLASIEAKLREKIMAELRASPTPPPSLTTERSVGQRTPPAWAGHASLEDLLDQ